MLKNLESPVIFGDGTNSRDFTFVENVVQANHLAALVGNREALNQVYNVACGERTSLNRLYEILRELTGKHDRKVLKIEPIYGPERAGDIPHSQASIEKAMRILGYLPSHSVEDGLKESVDWFWNNL
jgi:UDP-N-acetylglucosamine 4-epimerase